MAFSKITRILLWVIAGISLVVVLFFYISPKTVDMDDMELREQNALNPPMEMSSTPLPAVEADSTETAEGEELAAEGDTLTVEEEAPAPVLMPAAPVSVDYSEIFTGWELLVWNRIDIALVWAYIVLILAAIAAIVFPLIAVMGNTRALIRLVAVLVGAAIIVVVSWLMSSDAPMTIIGYDKADASDPATLKMIDTVLFVTYVLFGIALGSILYAIISKAFK